MDFNSNSIKIPYFIYNLNLKNLKIYKNKLKYSILFDDIFIWQFPKAFYSFFYSIYDSAYNLNSKLSLGSSFYDPNSNLKIGNY